MPIRLAGTDTYHVPDNWTGLIPLIQHTINTEHANNPNWRDYNAYLTVHYTPHLNPGEQQRSGGAHTDGFQGARQTTKVKTGRNYVMVTNGGTIFYPQRFTAALNPAKKNIFQGFDQQVAVGLDGKPITALAEEGTLYYFDAYTVHESGLAVRPGPRLFVRLTFELAALDAAANTRNQMLSYDWPVHTYDIRQDLTTPNLLEIETSRLIPSRHEIRRILITGNGRIQTPKHVARIHDILDGLVLASPRTHLILVHGNQPGVDTIAAQYAEQHLNSRHPAVSHEPHPLPWVLGKPTARRHNSHMLGTGIDHVIAVHLQGDPSRGTDDAVTQAQSLSIPVHAITL